MGLDQDSGWTEKMDDRECKNCMFEETENTTSTELLNMRQLSRDSLRQVEILVEGQGEVLGQI